jgi:hypothetical protein
LMSHRTIDARRLVIGLCIAAGATSGLALSGSALAKADDFACPSDLCGTSTLVGPFDFTSVNIPADDYSNVGSFILGPDGFPDATGYVITSGGEMPEVNGIATSFLGMANETLLYTDIGGVIGSPVELLPFDLPL